MLATLLISSFAILNPIATDPAVTVTVDSAKRIVTIVAGPFTIPGMPAGMDHGEHGMHEMEGHTTPFLSFDWPITGWLRGFKIELATGKGQPLNRRLIHHVNMMNFERRQLIYDAVERMLAAGQETKDLALPRTIGLPMTAGAEVGLYSAWANDSETAIEDAYLTITYEWSPTNLSPRPLDAMPLYMDVNYQGPGVTDSYDLPAGQSTKSFDFTLPTGGRLLAAGGHLHDYARYVELVDLETGKSVLRLNADLDKTGLLKSVEQKLFAVRGDGIRLHGGRRYRITAAYNNTTGKDIPLGAMGIIAGLFVPDSREAWPNVDREHPMIAADIRSILSIGGGASHSHDK